MHKLQRFIRSEEKAAVLRQQVGGYADTARCGQWSRFAPRFKRFRKSLGVLAEKPYPLNHYATLLAALKANANEAVMPLTAIGLGTRRGIVLRHDVDQPRCLTNLDAMIELEQAKGFVSSCYFRMDGLPYDPQEALPRRSLRISADTAVCYWSAEDSGDEFCSVLTPLLVGDRIGLHPVAVIFAVLAGGQLFGFVGVLLGLPVAAVLAVLLRHAHQRYLASGLYEGAD